MEVSGHIDVDQARRRTWDAVRLRIDSVDVPGKHNDQDLAVDTRGGQNLDLMDLRSRGHMLVIERAECHFSSLVDQLEL